MAIVTTWEHSDPFVPGTTVRADAMNVKLSGIAVNLSAIDEYIQSSLMKFPSSHTGNTTLPDSIVSNSFIFFDENNNLSLFKKDLFDSDVANTKLWRDEVLAIKNASAESAASAKLSEQAAAGYAGEVGAPTIVSGGGVFNIPDGQSFIEIVCVGDATIVTPLLPGVNAKYVIKATGLNNEVDILTSGGSNTHEIDNDDINTNYTAKISGVFELDLFWLGNGKYRGF